MGSREVGARGATVQRYGSSRTLRLQQSYRTKVLLQGSRVAVRSGFTARRAAAVWARCAWAEIELGCARLPLGGGDMASVAADCDLSAGVKRTAGSAGAATVGAGAVVVQGLRHVGYLFSGSGGCGRPRCDGWLKDNRCMMMMPESIQVVARAPRRRARLSCMRTWLIPDGSERRVCGEEGAGRAQGGRRANGRRGLLGCGGRLHLQRQRVAEQRRVRAVGVV